MNRTADLSDYLKSLTFIAFDTETTGIWAPAHRIVEIGAVKFRLTDHTESTYESLVKPDRSIPQEVTAIHGITDEMVADAPPIGTVLDEFAQFCGKTSVLVAHHAPFDISFVACELQRTDRTFGNNMILDTIDLHQRYSPGLASYSLLSLVEHFGIAKSQRHRALADAEFVRRLVLEIGPRLSEITNEKQLREYVSVYNMDSCQQDARLPDEFADLSDAVGNSRRVRIEYASHSKPPNSRIVRPTNVYSLGTRIYINAWCERTRGERTFRLDRIIRYEILSE